MTHGNTTRVLFSSVGQRELLAEFNAGHIGSDAGLLLLREADRRIGLLDAVDAAFADPRCPQRIVHPQRTLRAQRIFGLAAGYEDLNEHGRLRFDPLWQAGADHPEVDGAAELAASPTLRRFKNHIDRPTLVRLASVLVDQFIASFEAPPEELTLDFDATDDPVHGDQEKRFFHGYYDSHCFLSGLALRGVRAGGGASLGGAAGDSLHAQARQLAEHGGDRVGRLEPSVPGSAHREHRGGP